MTALADLTKALEIQKEIEKAAMTTRRNIERDILNHPDILAELKSEGTTKFENLTIQTGFTRTWDTTCLREIEEKVKPEFFPFITQLKEDRKASKVIEARFPVLWKELSLALTLKPKKPQLTIKQTETTE